MLSRTPAMGWNSWNTFAADISDSLIRETAEAMIDNGLRDLGYQYVVIDDCWSEKQRGADDKLRPDLSKFPNGMKALGDYIHSKSMKFGMYSCSGIMTCAKYPGSYEHEFIDAQTFADWGVDYFKYDYCYKPLYIEGHLLYKRMAMALRSCNRDILFSACSWGNDDAESFMRSAGAHMWRSTGDIMDNWESIKGIIKQQTKLMPYGAPGCFNDMDMLVAGMHGKGNVGLGGCTDEEYKTHFSVWCLFNSPLMIGCDVRKLDDETKKILTNREMIAINQDPEGRQPWLIEPNSPYTTQTDGNFLFCARPLSDGTYAIGIINFADSEMEPYLNFWDLGLPFNSGYSLQLRDLWLHEDIGVFKEGIHAKLAPHACVVYKAKLVPCNT